MVITVRKKLNKKNLESVLALFIIICAYFDRIWTQIEYLYRDENFYVLQGMISVEQINAFKKELFDVLFHTKYDYTLLYFFFNSGRTNM